MQQRYSTLLMAGAAHQEFCSNQARPAFRPDPPPPSGQCLPNRIRIPAALSFRLRQFCDDSGNGLVHLINLISVIAVVLHDEGRAYTCEYDNEFAHQPADSLAPALLLI
jgi:hypothetical protein